MNYIFTGHGWVGDAELPTEVVGFFAVTHYHNAFTPTDQVKVFAEGYLNLCKEGRWKRDISRPLRALYELAKIKSHRTRRWDGTLPDTPGWNDSYYIPEKSDGEEVIKEALWPELLIACAISFVRAKEAEDPIPDLEFALLCANEIVRRINLLDPDPEIFEKKKREREKKRTRRKKLEEKAEKPSSLLW